MGGGKKKKKKKRERERERERGGGEELRALVTLVIQTLAAMSKTISSDSLYRMDGVKDRWGEEEEEEEERERERERERGGGEELRALVTLVIQTLAAMSKTVSSDSLYRMDGVRDGWGEEEEEEEREREREGGRER